MTETLVVVSKVKAIIKQLGMNTSASAIDALSKIVEEECKKAVANAEKAKRKTVMDRDIVSCGQDDCGCCCE